MSAAIRISHGKSETRGSEAEGGVFVLCIDRAKMIHDLLELVNNTSCLPESQN